MLIKIIHLLYWQAKSKSFSNRLIPDLRAIIQEISHTNLVSTLKNLGSKWGSKDIMPPYIDVLSGMFPANIMSRPTFLKNGLPLRSI